MEKLLVQALGSSLRVFLITPPKSPRIQTGRLQTKNIRASNHTDGLLEKNEDKQTQNLDSGRSLEVDIQKNNAMKLSIIYNQHKPTQQNQAPEDHSPCFKNWNKSNQPQPIPSPQTKNKTGHPQGKLVFQPSIFRGKLGVFLEG